MNNRGCPSAVVTAQGVRQVWLVTSSPGSSVCSKESALTHRRFVFEVPEADLQDLRTRLRRTRWPLFETLDRLRLPRFPGKRCVELGTRADRELGEHLVQVILDGPRADEET